MDADTNLEMARCVLELVNAVKRLHMTVDFLVRELPQERRKAYLEMVDKALAEEANQ